ncbi:MAG: ANTAR domain-containing protein [Bacillota bacterium]|jgi:response regulator NasT|nr:ANTAR domain-containing protein [Thermoanaerobacteraceae bacterium]
MMTVVLICSNKGLRHRLRELLRAWGWAVIGETATGPESLRFIRSRQPDLIIMDDELAGTNVSQLMDVISQDRLAPVLLLLSPNNRWGEELLRRSAVMAAVSKPLNEADFYLAVLLAEANFSKFNVLELEISRLQDQLQARKVIERAKGILMETLGLSEQEAYRRMQRESMERRTSMRAIAEAIITAQKFYPQGRSKSK